MPSDPLYWILLKGRLGQGDRLEGVNGGERGTPVILPKIKNFFFNLNHTIKRNFIHLVISGHSSIKKI